LEQRGAIDGRFCQQRIGIACGSSSTCPLTTTCTRPQALKHMVEGGRDSDPVDYLIIIDSPNLEDSYHERAFASQENQFFLTPLFNSRKSFAMSFIYRGHFLTVEDRMDLPIISMKRKTKTFAQFTKRVRQISATAAEKKPVVAQCFEYLKEDIRRLRPRFLIVVGTLAKDTLFPNEPRPISRLSDFALYYEGIPARFITHPSVLLKSSSGEKQWYAQLEAILQGRVLEKDTKLGETKILTKLDETRDFIHQLKSKPNNVAIDLETENLNKRYGNRIATIQFSEDNESGVVIPYHHKESPFLPEEIEIIRADLFDLFSKPSKILHWVGHHLKFECNVLHSVIGTPLLSAPMFDTQIGSFLLDENRKDRIVTGEFKYGVYTLKQLVLEYLNFDGYDKNILEARDEGNLFDLPLQDLAVYGCIDTYKSRALMEAELSEAVAQDFLPKFINLMYSFCSPEILLFSEIERTGFPIDRAHLRYLLSRESPLLSGIKEIEEEFRKSQEVIRANEILLHGELVKGAQPKIMPLGHTPFVFDLGKKGHAQALFFKVLNLKQGRLGKNGLASVDEEWQKENLENTFVQKYAEWSMFRHMYNTFASKTYNRIDPAGRDVDCNTDCSIRSNYLLARAVTGRVISKAPNLQQCPRADSPPKKAIKDMFTSIPGHILLQVDFKANEMRWAGIVSKDIAMAKNFKMGQEAMAEYKKNPDDESLYKRAEMYSDIHRQNASSAFGIPIESVSKDQRQQAKSLTFAVLYDGSERSIAAMFGLDVGQVKKMVHGFYKNHPHLYRWKLLTKWSAIHNGYAEAPHGRRRRLEILKSVRPGEIQLLRRIETHDGNTRTEEIKNIDDLSIDSLTFSEYFSVSQDLGMRRSTINEALRQATNAIIQGIASDSGMVGGALFAEYIRNNKKPWIINNAVHDSVVWQVPYSEIDETLRVAEQIFTEGVTNYMSAAFDIEFNLPLDIDFETGSKWGSLKSWKFNYKELPAIIDMVRSEKKELST